MAINKQNIDDVFGATTIEDDNPFPDYVPADQLPEGKHKAILTKIEVLECPDKQESGKFYKAIRFTFQGLGVEEVATCQFGASYGPKAKLHGFISGISPNPEKFRNAFKDKATAWKYIQALKGHLYVIKTQMSGDGKYSNVVAGMFEAAAGKFENKKPEQPKSAPTGIAFEDDDLPY